MDPGALSLPDLLADHLFRRLRLNTTKYRHRLQGLFDYAPDLVTVLWVTDFRGSKCHLASGVFYSRIVLDDFPLTKGLIVAATPVNLYTDLHIFTVTLPGCSGESRLDCLKHDLPINFFFSGQHVRHH